MSVEQTSDPQRFISDALDLLPRNPADMRAGHWERLPPIRAGLEQLIARHWQDLAAIAARVEHGARRADHARELAVALRGIDRGEIARRELHDYLTAAAEARGITQHSHRAAGERSNP